MKLFSHRDGMGSHPFLLFVASLVIVTNVLKGGFVRAFDYEIDTEETKIDLIDVETGISSIKSFFLDELTGIKVKDINWVVVEDGNTSDASSNETLTWITMVNGKTVATGNLNLLEFGRLLPTEIDAGEVLISGRGKHSISVQMFVGSSNVTVGDDYMGYKAGVSLIPLLVVLLLAVTTQMVELSLFTAVFVGACIIAGNMKDGFKDTLSVYILDALSNADHCKVVLFTLFLAGLVGMIEKSGGMFGFTQFLSKYARSARGGQFACYGIGCFIFFDDYANCLLAGETMRPLLDSLMVSREKLSFIVDATAAPIASISPVSSWVGFEVQLIQEEINLLKEQFGDELTIKTSGLAVFLQSIKYRYYPIFMIVFMFTLIFAKRDFGPMLLAERKVTVYERIDGGDGKGAAGGTEGATLNKPKSHVPLFAFNMFIPIILLVFMIFYLLVKTGEDGTDQSIMDKIENGSSYDALLWGTMGATVCTMIFYMLQWYKDGSFSIPNPKLFAHLLCTKDSTAEILEDGEPVSVARPLLTVHELMDGFLHGMARIFPALIVLNLAWASGSIMRDVGADRLFARWITGGLDPEILPTLVFLISFLMALATGTSWGTMTILFPLVLRPTYIASNGNDIIFYSVTAGILSGSVAGDHVSPISDTTVLSALACDCKLLNHVATQTPYVIVTLIMCILVGTIPIGYEAWPNIIGILLGCVLLVGFVYGFCVPVSCPSGRYDFIMELKQKMKEDPALTVLRNDAIEFFGRSSSKKDGSDDAHSQDSDVKKNSPDSSSDGKIPEEIDDEA